MRCIEVASIACWIVTVGASSCRALVIQKPMQKNKLLLKKLPASDSSGTRHQRFQRSATSAEDGRRGRLLWPCQYSKTCLGSPWGATSCPTSSRARIYLRLCCCSSCRRQNDVAHSAFR